MSISWPTSLINKEFKHLVNISYFNSAFLGPLPERTTQKIKEYTETLSHIYLLDYQKWLQPMDEARDSFAQLLKVDPCHISLQTSVSDTIAMLARTFPFKKEDYAVVIDKDYPSIVLPWMQHRYMERYSFKTLPSELRFDSDKFLNNLPKRTKIVAISHVGFQNGHKIDLKILGSALKQRNIYFVVDTTQGLGGLNLNTDELNVIDVLVVSPYKWLLSPYGQSLAYFSKDIQKILPTQSCHIFNRSNADKNPESLLDYTTETSSGAKKYDRGQPANNLNTIGFKSSLSLIQDIGLEHIEKHNLELVNFFWDNAPTYLKKLRPNEVSTPIVTFPTKDVSKTIQRLQEKNIFVSGREENLRICFHLFNTKQQVENFIDEISRLLSPKT